MGCVWMRGDEGWNLNFCFLCEIDDIDSLRWGFRMEFG